ncbi:hypothetical protein G6F66_002456 [Rhizopus arrhizus]|nr:hypothetical protein G6F66_002456 [Rhizopus arrhizus]
MLQCEVCKKEFTEFDQRGFRNAGFTAHHNRCIDRQTHRPSKKPTVRCRFLLPAPKLEFRNDSLLQGHDNYLLSTTARKPFLANVFERSQLDVLNDYASPQFASSTSILTPTSVASDSCQDKKQMYYPVTYCDYCEPQDGSHKPNCILFYSLPK